MGTRRLLIVDDDEGIRRQLKWAFDGFSVAFAANREQALDRARQEELDVALVDLGLPPDIDSPVEGLNVIQELLQLAPELKVIAMTGQTDRSAAVRAIALGAHDFYEKPIEIDVLNLIVARAQKVQRLEAEVRNLARAQEGQPLPGMTTADPAMLRLSDQVRRFAPTGMAMLLLGESGTGKELIARAVHELSGRDADRFIAINCAAIPEQLLESELFGYEKGAFSGAVRTTPGKTELADGGTLFLDEVGDLPLGLQAKLLRFLQDHKIDRVGGRRSIQLDVRVVAATNRELSKAVEAQRFRGDLYFRLSEAVVEIPPLRERPEDAVLIAHKLLHGYAAEQKRAIQGFSPDGIAAVSAYPWPGNVRELQNRIKRAVVSAEGMRVTAADLGFDKARDDFQLATLKEVRAAAEAKAVRAAMAAAGGNISKAARILDISRPTLYDLLRAYEIDREELKSEHV